MESDKQFDNTMKRGQAILEKILPTLNAVSYERIRTAKESFRRKEDFKELVLALGLYDEHIEGLLV